MKDSVKGLHAAIIRIGLGLVGVPEKAFEVAFVNDAVYFRFGNSL